MNDKKNNEKNLKKIKTSTLILSVFVFVLVTLIIATVVAYRFSDRVFFADSIKSILPLPAIIVNGTSFVTVKEINNNLLSIKKFYENQDFSSLGYIIDFETEDGKKRLKIREKELINKMIEDDVIRILSKERGIIITNKLVDESVDRKISEYGGRDFIENNLNNLYGWSLEDFKEKIVKPSLYKDELEKWVAKNDKSSENERAKMLAEEAMEDIKAGKDFTEVLNEVSEEALGSGNKLGWFKKEYISVDLQEAVASLEEGEISDVLESDLGYHIIKLERKKSDDEENELYDISQIYFPKALFADWLSDEIKKININILVVDYKWNEETGMIEFQDKDMEKFEFETLEEKLKDPSVLSI